MGWPLLTAETKVNRDSKRKQLYNGADHFGNVINHAIINVAAAYEAVVKHTH
jgi:hypothetical protein